MAVASSRVAQLVQQEVSAQLKEKGILKFRDLYMGHQFADNYNHLIAPFQVPKEELQIPTGLQAIALTPASDQQILPLPSDLLRSSLRFTPSVVDPIKLQAQKRAKAAAEAKSQQKPKRRRKDKDTSSTSYPVTTGYYDPSPVDHNIIYEEDEDAEELTEEEPPPTTITTEEENAVTQSDVTVSSSRRLRASVPQPQPLHVDDSPAVMERLFNHFYRHPSLKLPQNRVLFFSLVTPETVAMLGIPDYFDKAPMAVTLLDIRKRKMEGAGGYGLEDLVTDMRQMFNNALAYYDTARPEYQLTLDLKTEFEAMLKEATG